MADEGAQVRAQRLFDEGRALVAAGRSREACPKFEESDRLDPGGGTRLNLAICYEETGRLVAAHTAFRDSLDRAIQQGRKDREEIAREHLATLEPRIPKVVVVGGPAANARVDGLPVNAQEGGRFFVDPGLHDIELVPGRRQSFSLVEGEVRVIDVRANPTEARRPPTADVPSTTYSVTYNPVPILGLAVALAGSGVAMFGVARLISESDDGSGKWILLGGGVAAIAGTLTMFVVPFTEAKPRSTAALGTWTF